MVTLISHAQALPSGLLAELKHQAVIISGLKEKLESRETGVEHLSQLRDDQKAGIKALRLERDCLSRSITFMQGEIKRRKDNEWAQQTQIDTLQSNLHDSEASLKAEKQARIVGSWSQGPTLSPTPNLGAGRHEGFSSERSATGTCAHNLFQ